MTGLGSRVKDTALKHLNEKAARDIYTKVKEWRSNKRDTAKRRWLFELIQNALDTHTARREDIKPPPKLKIEIARHSNEDGRRYLTFRHNGGYFTLMEICAIIFGGSTRELTFGIKEPKYLGRFGSGFLVSHIVSPKVDLCGWIKEDGSEEFYKFRITINRDGDTVEEISKNIEACFSQLDSAEKVRPPDEDFLTEYTYYFEKDIELGQAAVDSGVDELLSCLSFIFAFNSSIEEIKIDDKKFERAEIENGKGGNTIKTKAGTVEIDVVDETGNRRTQKRNVEVAILLRDAEIAPIEKIPKIFAGMPLIETEKYIHIPFVINSQSFEPTEERNSLYCGARKTDNGQINEKLLQKAFEIYIEMLKDISRDSGIKALYRCVDFECVCEEYTSQNPIWEEFNRWMKRELSKIVREIPVVETLDGRKTIIETTFPVYGKISEIEEPLKTELFLKFYNLIASIWKSIPKNENNELSWWPSTIDRISLIINDTDLRGKLKESCICVEEFTNRIKKRIIKDRMDKSYTQVSLEALKEGIKCNNLKNFLHDLYEILNELYKKGKIKCDIIDFLIPTQSGNLSKKDWGDGRTKKMYYEKETLTEEFKEIIKDIGWKIKDSLVDRDFALVDQDSGNEKYEILTDYVYPGTVGDIIQIVKEGNYISEFKNDTQSRGWVALFKWCVKYRKEIIHNLPIFTKNGKAKRYSKEDPKMFLIPFEYMNSEMKEYETLYPPERMLHPAYFEGSDAQHILECLRKDFRAIFVDSLLLYKEEGIKISSGELRYILVDKSKIPDGDHSFHPPEGKTISELLFLDEILQKIGSPDDGKMFFEFLIKYIINKDDHWKQEITVNCSCKKSHKIIPALWLAKIRSYAWVPQKKGENVSKQEATKETIENLLAGVDFDELIKTDEAKKFLVEFFGFDKLDLAIKARNRKHYQDEKDLREELANCVPVLYKCKESGLSVDELPQIVEIGIKFKESNLEVIDISRNSERIKPFIKLCIEKPGSTRYIKLLEYFVNNNKDPEKILSETIEDTMKNKIREENRKIGENVEKVVEHIFVSYGITPERINRGGDFEIWPEREGVGWWDGGLFSVSSYVVEVKFTSTDRVHLSKQQSNFAKEKRENYILLIIEDGNIREYLKNMDEKNIPEVIYNSVMSNSRIIEGIHRYFVEITNPEEVEPDLQGYWVKKKLWENRKENICEWLSRIGPQVRGTAKISIEL